MTGLMIKDFYATIKESRIFILFIICMGLAQNDFLMSFALFYSSMLSITALAYDERSKWPKYADMLPLSTAQIVGSKYMMGCICVGTASLIAACGKLSAAAMGKELPSAEEWMILLLIFLVSLIVQSVNLPLMFWIGVEKGRYLFILCVIIAASCATSFLDTIQPVLRGTGMGILLLGAAGLTLCINLVSFQISNLLYNRKK